jgi:predicted TIM-barrel fold metal-dependent hydrolase
MANIDFHVHITPPDISANWRKYAEKEPWFSLLSESPQNRFAPAEDVIAGLAEAGQEKQTEFCGVDRAVVFGFGFRDMGLCRYVNDYVIEKTRQYPEKLTGFMSVAPCSTEAAREIERCHSAGLKGAGELFPDFLENEKETKAFTGVCKELGLPVLIHTNEPVGHYYPGKSNVTLQQIEKFIEKNPGLTIVLAHWGGGLFLYEAMPELREKFRNVYYDTAATPYLYDRRIYSAANALGLCEKILFGSDFPLLRPSRYLDALEESGLSAEEKQLILGGNAQRLFERTDTAG